MLQTVVGRRRVLTVVAMVVTLVSVVWVGAMSRADAASSGTPVVYVATGENFPDALGAASAAAVQRGPVLLVTKTSIPDVTEAELKRLDPDVIYVAGGTAMVSDAVFNQLKTYAATVKRVWGASVTGGSDNTASGDFASIFGWQWQTLSTNHGTYP